MGSVADLPNGVFKKADTTSRMEINHWFLTATVSAILTDSAGAVSAYSEVSSYLARFPQITKRAFLLYQVSG